MARTPSKIVESTTADVVEADTAFGVSIDEPDCLNPQLVADRRVLIVHTGGTIGMQKAEDGSLKTVSGALKAQLQQLDELKSSTSMPLCFLCETDPLIDSADMCPSDWSFLAKLVEQYYFAFDGFVIIHGTDTMAYTASALSFMLQNLGKPIILTGAQVPIFQPYSDARRNLVGAIVFAGFTDCLNEVCIFFNDQLLRGNRACKSDATSLHAFESPNFPPLAYIGSQVELQRHLLLAPPRGRFQVHLSLQSKILVVHLVPGFDDTIFEVLATSTPKTLSGLVLMLYGCGNAPARKVGMVKNIRKMVDSDVVVVVCSQCAKGTVALGNYSVGKVLEEVGVVGAGDMTTEAVCAKMAYLLARNMSVEQVRQSMKFNLRGEVTQVIPSALEQFESRISGLYSSL